MSARLEQGRMPLQSKGQEVLWTVFPLFFIYDFQPVTDLIIRVCTPRNVQLESKHVRAWLGDQKTGQFPLSSIQFQSGHVILLSHLTGLDWFKTQADSVITTTEKITKLFIGDHINQWMGDFVVGFLPPSSSSSSSSVSPLVGKSNLKQIVATPARSQAYSLEFSCPPDWTKEDQKKASKLINVYISGKIDTDESCAARRADLLERISEGDRSQSFRLLLGAACKQQMLFMKRKKESKESCQSETSENVQKIKSENERIQDPLAICIRTLRSEWSTSPNTFTFNSAIKNWGKICGTIVPAVRLDDIKLLITIASESLPRSCFSYDGQKIIINYRIQQLPIIQQYLESVSDSPEKRILPLTVSDGEHRYYRDLNCIFISHRSELINSV